MKETKLSDKCGRVVYKMVSHAGICLHLHSKRFVHYHIGSMGFICGLEHHTHTHTAAHRITSHIRIAFLFLFERNGMTIAVATIKTHSYLQR